MNHDFNSGHATVAPTQRKNGLIGRLTAGKSAKLPTYIDYNKVITAKDDKHAKHRYGRLVNRANTAKGWAGALLRSAIRAGLLEGIFWRRLAILVTVLLSLSVCFQRACDLICYNLSGVHDACSSSCFTGPTRHI
jgi:hypothetical protein